MTPLQDYGPWRLYATGAGAGRDDRFYVEYRESVNPKVGFWFGDLAVATAAAAALGKASRFTVRIETTVKQEKG